MELTTINDIPYEIFHSNIFLYLMNDPDFDIRLFIKNSLVCKYWHNIIYNNDFINIFLKNMRVKRPEIFNTLFKPIERMKYAINIIYTHNVNIYNEILTMADCVYDLVLSNCINITGNIENILMIRDDDNNNINVDNLSNINYKNVETMSIYTCMPHFPNNINLWSIELDIYFKNKVFKKETLFSTTHPENYRFTIKGNCRVKELELKTHLYRYEDVNNNANLN